MFHAFFITALKEVNYLHIHSSAFVEITDVVVETFVVDIKVCSVCDKSIQRDCLAVPVFLLWLLFILEYAVTW